jgi:hypothetical protein
MIIRRAKDAFKLVAGRLGYEILRTSTYASLIAARAAPPSDRSTLSHRALERQEEISLTESPKSSPCSTEIEYCERVVEAFHRSVQAHKQYGAEGPQDIWTYSAGTVHKDFIDLLMKGKIRKVAECLCNMSSQGVTHGLSVGAESYRLLKLSDASSRFIAAYVWDRLLALNEAIGTVRVENPEQGPWEENCRIGVNDLVEKANAFFGINIVPDVNDGECLGLGTRYGVLMARDLYSVYAAYRLKQLTKCSGEPASEICEIGSGIGRLIHYLAKFGFSRIWSFDLPYVQVLAGFEALKSLGGRGVALFGEDRKDARVVFMPHFSFGEHLEPRFSITVNQDSMPEMGAEIVKSYLRQIRSNTSRYFVSINHESMPMGHYDIPQNNVSDLIRDIGGFRLMRRDRFWLREGYVEEIYAPG